MIRLLHLAMSSMGTKKKHTSLKTFVGMLVYTFYRTETKITCCYIVVTNTILVFFAQTCEDCLKQVFFVAAKSCHYSAWLS